MTFYALKQINRKCRLFSSKYPGAAPRSLYLERSLMLSIHPDTFRTRRLHGYSHATSYNIIPVHALYCRLADSLPAFPLYIGIELDEIAKPDLLGQPFLMIEDQVSAQECLLDLSTQSLAQIRRNFVSEFE